MEQLTVPTTTKRFCFFRKSEQFNLETFETKTVNTKEHEFSLSFDSKQDFIDKMKNELKKYIAYDKGSVYLYIDYKRTIINVLFERCSDINLPSSTIEARNENSLLFIVNKIIELVKSVEAKGKR